MALVLTNAILLDLDPIGVERASLRLDGGIITARGTIEPGPGDELIDCGGAIVLPGLVNGHTHLYSALAVGMPSPPRTPTNFLEILELIWWRLDQALDSESIELSARIGAIEALHCGTTTLIDHHASPNAIEASLDWLERGLAAAGLRGVLCYETTDRHGPLGREAGLAENRRYLEKCAAEKNGRFAALVGAHASFTLEEKSLESLAALAEEFGSGIHIHVAEDPCDEQTCRREQGIPLIDRLDGVGLLRPETVFAHGTHLNQPAVDRVNRAGLTLAHNTRSNMNNAVGYAPLGRLQCPVMLGTDGIGADMFAEVQTAWFKSRDGNAGISPAEVIEMLAQSARRASAALGVTLGKLQPGAVADVVITDYQPFTPIHPGNAIGHFLFGLTARHVRHVLIGGRFALRDRTAAFCDEPGSRLAAAAAAQDLWRRMANL
jgi:putative selenium metabolism protein SsnA